MNLLQISGYDSPGDRFNGLAIAPILERSGVESHHLVWEKYSSLSNVTEIGGVAAKAANKIVAGIEAAMSVQSMFYPTATSIMKMPVFRDADLLHLHIIHSGFFSIGSLPAITSLKPTVWTLHDPWALTGHCIHPFECVRWKIGCGDCPDLESPFALRKDKTKLLFDYKRKAYQESKLELIVSSGWMRSMVEKSPMFEGVRVHQVPFGVDLNFFQPDRQDSARSRLGIQDDALVIFFRCVNGPFKGLEYITRALNDLLCPRPVVLLTITAVGLLRSFSGKYDIREFGFVTDQNLVRDLFQAADIFLMPSMAESFGMMAVEAMASSKPVICFDNTAIAEITFGPDVGLSVPYGDSTAFSAALQYLVDNPLERQRRGSLGRTKVEKYYSDLTFARRLVDIYSDLLEN